jgi:hypothetical protein
LYTFFYEFSSSLSTAGKHKNKALLILPIYEESSEVTGMKEKYFFGINYEKVGPLDEESIRQRIAEGVITSNTLAWCKGMGDWKPIHEISELMEAFNQLHETNIEPPPFPGGEEKTQEPKIPPLPETDTATSADASKQTEENAAKGLGSLNEAAYRFVLWTFRSWGKRPSPIRSYVLKDPKRAVPVAAGTILLLVLIIGMWIASMGGGNEAIMQQAGQQQSAQQQSGTPPPGWQDQYRTWKDQQQANQKIIDDTYKYRRDSQDRMDESYRRGTYDWYKKD